MTRKTPRFRTREYWTVTHSRKRDGRRLWTLGAQFTASAIAFTLGFGYWEMGMRFTNEDGEEFAVIEGNGDDRQALINVKDHNHFMYPYYNVLQERTNGRKRSYNRK